MNFYRVVLICWFLLISFWISGQDVILETQADVDSFDSTTLVIQGNLFIGFDTIESNIINLGTLNNLDSVVGNLRISHNVHLNHINELSNLTSIGGELILAWNDNLSTIDGLNALTSIGDNLEIFENKNLSSIEGLRSVSSINGGIRINSNHKLMNLNGLNNLSSVGEHLLIINNDNLINIDGLSNIDSVGRMLTIAINSKLDNINGLSNLDYVDDFFQVVQNDILFDCCAVQSLIANRETAIGSNTVLINNNSLSCNSLEDIVSNNCPLGAINRGMSIYPNPSYGLSTVSFEYADSGILEMFNATGSLVNQVEFENAKQVEIHMMMDGLYYVRVVTNENLIFTDKVIFLH